MSSTLNLYRRKKVVEDFYSERVEKAPRRVSFPQLQLRLPHLELNKKFTAQPIATKPLDEEQIKQILEASEKHSTEDELNCGACGYPTCRDEAIAIFQGMAEWDMCFPFQKKVYQSMMEELKTASTTDWLTNLFNYNGLVEHLEVEMKKAKRYNYPLSLIMLDVDLFKQVNDTYGHVIGDELLKSMAEVILHNVRGADIIARYGGDEFTLILPETSKAQAYLVAEKLRRKMESNTFQFEGGVNLNITISLGIAINLPETDSSKSFIDRADRAMYLAKQAGRNYTELSEEW
jgi:diguanylate cyclase (GGDEF)-like protein